MHGVDGAPLTSSDRCARAATSLRWIASWSEVDVWRSTGHPFGGCVWIVHGLQLQCPPWPAEVLVDGAGSRWWSRARRTRTRTARAVDPCVEGGLMRVGVMADSHDRLPAVAELLRSMAAGGVGFVLHAGDYCSPFALESVRDLNMALAGVFGNNDGDREGHQGVRRHGRRRRAVRIAAQRRAGRQAGAHRARVE